MVENTRRRTELCDAGLTVLARDGGRGLTHRAVDREAAVPSGTASNYFRSRADLVLGLVDRIGERLAPDPKILAELAGRPPSRALFAAYMRDIVRRLTAERDVALALFELRLEATRRPQVAQVLGDWRRAAFAEDVRFTVEAGLPAGRDEVALFHYALDGLLLDRLTVPIDPQTPTDDVIDALVSGLLD